MLRINSHLNKHDRRAKAKDTVQVLARQFRSNFQIYNKSLLECASTNNKNQQIG